MVRIEMPRLGESVVEGSVVRWLKRPGEQVVEDEPLVEVASDKVDTEVVSPASGLLGPILVGEGVTVAVGTVIAEILAPGEQPSELADSAPAPTATHPVPTAIVPSPAASNGTHDGSAGRVSPGVRWMASVSGVDLSSVSGSGPGGRVTRADVEAHITTRPAARAAAPTEHDDAAELAEISEFARGAVVEIEDPSRMRRVAAERLRESVDTAAHAFTSVDIDFSGVDRVRRQPLPPTIDGAPTRLTYLPFVARAVTIALAEHPRLNGWAARGGTLAVVDQVHLGVAVDLAHEGLVVPIVHDAGSLRLLSLAGRIAELSELVRSGQVADVAFNGATFTISSVGSFGTRVSVPIINRPMVATMCIDGVRQVPVVVPDRSGWTITARPVGNVGISFDHRVVDGAYAASFLARVRELIETRDWSREL